MIRHSEAKAVKVQLTSSVDHVVLHVTDFGKGIPSERIATFMQTGAGVGVGLVGMRERLKELGGSLEIKSEGVGTEVIATLPPHLRDGLTAESKFSAA